MRGFIALQHQRAVSERSRITAAISMAGNVLQVLPERLDCPEVAYEGVGHEVAKLAVKVDINPPLLLERP